MNPGALCGFGACKQLPRARLAAGTVHGLRAAKIDRLTLNCKPLQEIVQEVSSKTLLFGVFVC